MPWQKPDAGVLVERRGTRGPRLLLLPGLGARGEGFRPLAERLERFAQPILVEYPTGPHAAVGHEELAGQVLAAVGSVEGVVASSFGGMVAAQLASRGATRGVAFVGSFTELDHLGARGALFWLMGPIAELGRPGLLAAAIAANRRVSSARVADIVPTTPLERRSVSHRALAVFREGAAPRLRERDVRCVVVHGAQDRLVPMGAVQRLLAHLPPGTPAHILEGAGHVPYFTHADAIAGILKPWSQLLEADSPERAAS